jgi:hypothetical protein
MLLGLKPGHASDVISVVAELMFDVAGVAAWPCVCGVISVATDFMVHVDGLEAWPCVPSSSMLRGRPLFHRLTLHITS